jgi:hypothetical protein
VAALDLEGRLYAVLDGDVLNRVKPEALAGQSTREQYLNPGGDGLWPAPEGTTLGYQYAAGAWRVPPGLRHARYVVTEHLSRRACIRAEVDLINSRGVGIPTLFERRVTIQPSPRSVTVVVDERITFIGRAPLKSADALLAPWSLCQFDSGPGCEVIFPCGRAASVWDLYDDPSDRQRTRTGQTCHAKTDGSQRYQIGLDKHVPWIQYRDPRRGLTVTRKAAAPPAGQGYIDIRDAAPDTAPGKRGVRYSVYSDPAGFMEIEAVGGCPSVIRPGTTMSVKVGTKYEREQVVL